MAEVDSLKALDPNRPIREADITNLLPSSEERARSRNDSTQKNAPCHAGVREVHGAVAQRSRWRIAVPSTEMGKVP